MVYFRFRTVLVTQVNGFRIIWRGSGIADASGISDVPSDLPDPVTLPPAVHVFSHMARQAALASPRFGISHHWSGLIYSHVYRSRSTVISRFHTCLVFHLSPVLPPTVFGLRISDFYFCTRTQEINDAGRLWAQPSLSLSLSSSWT
jgi:hypothetical protein